MINKMDEQRKWRCVNNEEEGNNCRRLRNELKRTTDKALKEYFESMCAEIMNIKVQDVMSYCT
jgi:hypothetical protein